MKRKLTMIFLILVSIVVGFMLYFMTPRLVKAPTDVQLQRLQLDGKDLYLINGSAIKSIDQCSFISIHHTYENELTIINIDFLIIRLNPFLTRKVFNYLPIVLDTENLVEGKYKIRINGENGSFDAGGFTINKD